MEKYDIVFVSAPIISNITPLLGIAYIRSYLKKEKINSKFIDLNNSMTKKIPPNIFYLMEINNKKSIIDAKYKTIIEMILDYNIDHILSFKPKLIAFSIFNSNEKMILKIIDMIKERDKKIKIVLGGPECGLSKSAYELIKNKNK